MPGRITPLVTGNYYHIFNRGSDKREIFTKPRDYSRFQKTFYYYKFSGPKTKFSQFSKASLLQPFQNEKIVEILCYCLMPNHFHFLVKQLKENGISNFLSQLSNSYTKYFNTKYNRIGALLQGSFKAVGIESEGQLIHVSRYIHLNPVVANLVKLPEEYNWSSFLEYLNQTPFFCSIDDIMGFFKTIQKYKQFALDQIDYGRTLQIIKHQLIDEV